MYAAWETGSEMYEEDADDIALIAIEESEPEPDSNFEEKEELVKTKNQIFASLTSLKFEYIDLEKLNAELKEKNKLLSQKVKQLESCNMSNKTEILKLTETGKVRESKQHWYMDSACSRHMTGDTSQFLPLKEGRGGIVAFDGGKKGQIKGIGKIGRSDEHSIDKVYHAEGLKHNLLNISQLVIKETR
ncbi:uncharacterized protein LOC125855783 [Solanum stenotomum]|uniref:uncharacterized protein LOC125855783 n=1 Tax=Solanum stenotomum TaxID=172797 RepID=UPI0020D0F48D|nr:uncharacterized protein LOC125855783 [Solanum stenotomum]